MQNVAQACIWKKVQCILYTGTIIVELPSCSTAVHRGMQNSGVCVHQRNLISADVPTSRVEAELDEVEEEDELSEIEVEQAPPVIPIPAPVEPVVKRKRGRPPKNKPQRKESVRDGLLLELHAKMSPLFSSL